MVVRMAPGSREVVEALVALATECGARTVHCIQSVDPLGREVEAAAAAQLKAAGVRVVCASVQALRELACVRACLLVTACLCLLAV